jgi:hypothetical protein
MGWLLQKRKKGELHLCKEYRQIMRLTFASTLPPAILTRMRASSVRTTTQYEGVGVIEE